jgi:hypothetical protein
VLCFTIVISKKTAPTSLATGAPTKTEEEKDFDEGKEEDTKILSHDKVAVNDSSTAAMTSNTTAKDEGGGEEEEEEDFLTCFFINCLYSATMF